MEETHDRMARNIAKKHMDEGISFLEECQQTAIEIGMAIEESEGEGTEAVRLLEDYCEAVYQAHEELMQGGRLSSGKQFAKKLRKILSKVKYEINDGIPTQYEVVFLPYKASMWDSLESVWKAADEDPDCDAYVIPIPYYDKKPDGSFAKLHYEIDQFPEYVPVTKYKDYDFEGRHPDKIYIHNPYDDCNLVTEVVKDFFSDKLKEYTDELVYIPYFVLGEPDPKNEDQLERMAHFVTVPGVMNADKVVVQSEKMKEAYVNILVKQTGEDTRDYWKKKISGEGSPKFDKVLSAKKEDFDIPAEWKQLLLKEDGTEKRSILYNTTVGAVLKYGENTLKKIRTVFSAFQEFQDDVTLWWRPHPLMESTLAAMEPEILDEYRNIVDDFRNGGWGIYDDTSDLNRAIAVCDRYYGDSSSVAWLFRRTRKPVMIQNLDFHPWRKAKNPMHYAEVATGIIDENGRLWFSELKYNSLFCYDLKKQILEWKAFFPSEPIWNTLLYRCCVRWRQKIVFIPAKASQVAIYDMGENTFRQIAVRDYGQKAVKFCNAALYGDNVIAFGDMYPCIMVIDMKSGRVSYYEDLHNKLDQLHNNDVDFYLARNIVTDEDGEHCYLLGAKANVLIRFSLQSLQFELIDLGGDGAVYNNLIKKGDQIYLIPGEKKKISAWSISKGHLSEYGDAVNGKAMYFARYCTKDTLYILPDRADHIIKVNLDTMDMEYQENELKNYYDSDLWNETVKEFPASKFLFQYEDDNCALFSSRMDRSLYFVINTTSQEEKHSLIVDRHARKRMDEQLFWLGNNKERGMWGTIFTERNLFSFRDFALYEGEGQSTVNEQLEENNCIGDLIWTESKFTT